MLDGRVLYVAAVPIAVWIVALRGGWRRTVVGLIALAHIAILANVALFPIPVDAAVLDLGRSIRTAHAGNGGLNVVPLATIGPVIAGHAAPTAARIAVLNVFVLTPAGIYLPLLFRSLRGWRGLVVLTLVGGASIEAAQLLVSTVIGVRYRWIDIDDVILNAVGIAIGWSIARTVLRAGRAPTRPGPQQKSQDALANR